MRTVWNGMSSQFARSAITRGRTPQIRQPSISRAFASARSSPGTSRSRWWRRGLVLGSLGGGFYVYDTYFNACAFQRTARSLGVIGLIALDYKLNFRASMNIEQLHYRNAERLFDLLITNKGLYIKIGQALALQASVFPPVFQKKFQMLFDNAPQDTQEQIKKTFYEEFGIHAEDLFESFDPECIASASVAQVHKAQLKSGEWVAVKIQHADIHKQVYWDLRTYKLIMKALGWFFELPLHEVSSFVASRMETETNFLTELSNGEATRSFLEKDSQLRNSVYIPINYPALSTKRVLVSEWIDGTPFGKVNLVKSEFSPNWALDVIMKFFAKQIFDWGCVHCDPHPGNILLRRHNGRNQVVMLDHGLYAYETPKFREENSRLWKSLFILDHSAVREVIKGWGIGSVDMFASMTVMRPYDSGEIVVKDKSDFEVQQQMLATFKNMIQDIDRIPMVITLIGRCSNILQGCNRMYGSPVNRIKIMAYQASKSYSKLHSAADTSHTWLARQLYAWVDHARFQLAVFMMDVAFVMVRIRQLFASSSRANDLGMESILERQMTRNAKSMGIEMASNPMFEG